MKTGLFKTLALAAALLASPLAGVASPALANDDQLEIAFDSVFGTQVRQPRDYYSGYTDPLVRQVAMLADGTQGRIGVAAIDLATGREVAILGDQRFPMASTSKIAIAAMFLDGVDRGRWSLTDRYPLILPVSSPALSSPTAPTRRGELMSAADLIDIMITRSSNPATDALLEVVGGPQAVTAWVRERTGITDFELTRNIATLVRDNREFNPATYIDTRDSVSPLAMARFLAGIYQGRYLSQASSDLIIRTMERTRTGANRIRGQMPSDVLVMHKTGTLHNTSSDVGLLTLPDGRTIALAVYVTGQGDGPTRDRRIAAIARAVVDGFSAAGNSSGRVYASAQYPQAEPAPES
ncbi:serine hydrolase [Altererythrobacter lauratis]|uniref:Beta-lactamase n=1 Tax=Alteraurantiacibacter lauratis TaxID=2054627 RepID=A0ABV7EHM1_9SPHN